MAKIVRFNGNLVAPASAALGTERTLFGSASQADDLTSQFTADLLRGWGIVGPSDQPTLQDFNAMGYTLGQLHAYLHQIGVAEWNAAQEYHIGSIANSGGVLFASLTNTNVGNDPASNVTNWSPIGAGATSVAMSNANVTLTALQAARPIIIITGTLTANIQLIFPAYVKEWLILNRATGSFYVTCKTASGTGVGVPAGTVMQIAGDGTNIVNSLPTFAEHGSVSFVAAGVTSWTVPLAMQLGIIKPKVTVIGGGGSGSRLDAAAGGGGGAGGASIGIVDLTGVTSVSVTVGAGGAATTAAGAGNVGSSSSFGAFHSATGGQPAPAAGGGGDGGSGVGGNIINPDGCGGGAAATGTSAGRYTSGAGGGSILAGAGRGRENNVAAAGLPGKHGGGGGGGVLAANSGAGGTGVVIIEW